jgi:D-amino-acid dehydrogenase
MRGAERGSVVIVGAGIVGLCAADALVRRGAAVTVVDRGAPERDGASFGNAGLIVPSHVVPLAAPGVLGQGLKWMLDPESPFFVQPRLDLELVRWGWRFVRSATARHVASAAPVLRDLHLASRALHLELAGRLPEAPPVEERGVMVLCATAPGLHEEAGVADRARALGLRVDVLDAAGVAARMPGLTLDVVGGVHYLDDAHASPRALMVALQASLAAAGVDFRWETAVDGLARDGRRVTGVRTPDGVIAASTVVIAGGVASSVFGRDLGVRLPMQPGRGYSVTIPDAPERPAMPALLAEARVAVTPFAEGVRLGGTMEIAPVERPVDHRRVRGITRSVARYLPAFRQDDLAALPVWSGARPVSPDGMPYLGRLTRVDGVVVATGHGMMGFSLGPVTGAIVADLVLGERSERAVPGAASPLLDPERFSGRVRAVPPRARRRA